MGRSVRTLPGFGALAQLGCISRAAQTEGERRGSQEANKAKAEAEGAKVRQTKHTSFPFRPNHQSVCDSTLSKYDRTTGRMGVNLPRL